MKNNIFLIIFSVFYFLPLKAENLNIQSSNIFIDKKTKITILKDKVVAIDEKNNIFKTDYAEYDKNLELLKSKDKTTILTSEGFFLTGKNITFDNKNNIIRSDDPATIKDLENNNIYLEKFEYSTSNNFFKSTGNIKLVDSNSNSYSFSQIYIDEKKREIIGTDSKAYLNQASFKINNQNKPRIFSNTLKITDQKSQFGKSIFTLCDYREKDKCPPWSIQAKQMTHDKKNKTIYYDKAVLKVYDLPIFYFPKLSHPDPTVDRRSGFLTPSFSDSKNLGSGLKVPYYMALNKDKDFTLTSKFFTSENPLLIGEYRQAFLKSDLILDFGYTEGYKKTSSKKKAGNKNHFFSKFVTNFTGKNNSDNNLEISLQEISNDKYLKLYKINTNLVNSNIDILENTFNFTHENDNFFLGVQASSYETLKDTYNDKYEYVLPDIILAKNLFSSNKFGNADLTSNLKVHNFDTNKFTKFFVNDIDWRYKDINFDSSLKGRFLAKIKNVNYEVKNVPEFKKDSTSEIFGALGYLSEIDLHKKTESSKHLLTPKMLFRYAPGHMRKETSASGRLNHLNIFSLDRLNAYNNFENGLSTTLGFDYQVKNPLKELNLSIGQVINEKENKDMPASSSLDQRFSDAVGKSNLKLNDNIKLNYNFSLDQNYRELNYNEIGTQLDFDPIKFDFNYLQEKEHIGNQKYFVGKVDFAKSTNGLFSAETKRNLITNSAEYYNLSYEYLNDCLRAGLVYRREFYNDSELEAENSLMFKITFVPFGSLSSPAMN